MTEKTTADRAALADFDNLPDAAFVRVRTVAALYSVTPACVWMWVNKGIVPAPRKLGPQVTAWRVGDIRKALATAEMA